ncbi:MAG: hypothetical protein H7177_17105 [Rhizobacter sp.]|nr:hypothetical protein [Bacteriovorax sp.]
MKKIIIPIFLVLNLLASVSFGQEQTQVKHPKVIEVEMLLSKEATSFLQQRIPNEPVYVNVEIDPLRRNSDVKNEQLPYFASEDEVSDEWDAIDTPMVLLLSRIKRAMIRVEVPNHVTDAEIVDLKEKLYEHLKLVPIRDSITFEKKSLGARAASDKKDNTLYYFITVISVVMFGGLFLSLKFTSPKIAPTLAATVGASAGGGNSATPPPRQHNSKKGSNDSNYGSFSSKVNGDINFKDSIRAADMLKEKLHGVINSSVFPMLSDMLILEELSNKSLSSLGAFIFELPRKHQQQVFFRGRSDKWFRAYIEASSVDVDCFMAVEKMLRNRNASGPEKWEELLIQVWRLQDEAHLFLKQIPQEEAFTILGNMPKSFSVPCAKKAFPGGWARVLDSKDAGIIEDEKKLNDYLARSLGLKPYFSFKSIDDYKKDLELVDYLRSATLKDEEEVYESLSSTSNIHKIRPPFYAIFKADDENFKAIFSQYDIYEWATAVLNAPRDYMKKISAELDEKKRYIFSNYLKQLDENQPSFKDQSSLREEMAKSFQLVAAQKLAGNKQSNDNDGMANEDETAQAA